MPAPVIAQVDHKPPVSHGMLLLAIALIAVVAAVTYGLVRLIGKRRADRTRSDRVPRPDRTPEP